MMAGGAINHDFVQSQPGMVSESMLIMGQPANAIGIMQSTK